MDHADQIRHLTRCVDLAEEAVDAGDDAFGSLLVGPDGNVLREERNEVGGGDATRHPEFALARWAATNLTPAERAASTVLTSGEHCPMCSTAHALVGLGPIVVATSTGQLGAWLAELGVEADAPAPLGIADLAPQVPVEGPFPEFAERVRALHRRAHARR